MIFSLHLILNLLIFMSMKFIKDLINFINNCFYFSKFDNLMIFYYCFQINNFLYINIINLYFIYNLIYLNIFYLLHSLYIKNYFRLI